MDKRGLTLLAVVASTILAGASVGLGVGMVASAGHRLGYAVAGVFVGVLGLAQAFLWLRSVVTGRW